MIDLTIISTNMLLAYSAYALGTASPGPSNLAVMAIAMNSGRKSSLIFSLGVVSGSSFWGIFSAFGLSVVLATCSSALVVMRMLGGLYLLFLAAKSAHSAFRGHTRPETTQPQANETSLKLYCRGAAMHLTNPKAIFVWLSIVALAMPVNAKSIDALFLVAGCMLIGLVVFCGYALLFSTATARRIYQFSRRWFEGALAVAFGYAGLRMLTSRA